MTKGERCQTLFAKMRDLSGAIAHLMQSLVADNSCCARLNALAEGLAGLMRCRSLLSLLRRMADAVLRLARAIGELIQLVCGRVERFLGEFDAGKKLGRFAKNAIQHCQVGKFTTGFVSNLLPGCG